MATLTEELSYQCYEAQVSKYIDGDTLDMNVYLGFDTYVIKRIRLLNIDAPEMHNTKKESVEHKAAEVALYVLKEFMYQAEGTYFLFAEHKGLYGRWLGEIWRKVGEESLNDHLISKGYYNGGWSWETQQDTT